MSEQTEVRGILLAHATMAAGVVDAVRQITGVGEDALVAMSNAHLSPQTLTERIESEIGSEPTLIFTDLQGGSCTRVAALFCRERTNVAALAGVNLPLLVDFVYHRELPISELVPRLLEKGHAGIRCTPAEWEDHVRRALSRG